MGNIFNTVGEWFFKPINSICILDVIILVFIIAWLIKSFLKFNITIFYRKNINDNGGNEQWNE